MNAGPAIARINLRRFCIGFAFLRFAGLAEEAAQQEAALKEAEAQIDADKAAADPNADQSAGSADGAPEGDKE